MNDIPMDGQADTRFAPLRDHLRDILQGADEWGASVAVRLDGKTRAHLVGGYADRARTTPITPDTRFCVFSCSKAVSSVVIAMLAGEGVVDYDAPVAHLWPAFAQGGKGAVTLAQLLSHQAGLSGIPGDWTAERFFDWEATTDRLAAMDPLWDLEEGGSGYHPITWGYLVDEVVRRATGHFLQHHLAHQISGPHEVAFQLGLPTHASVAQLRKPPKPPDLGEMNAPTRAAFVNTWYSPGLVRGREAWAELALPSAAGYGTAEGLAMMLEPFARAGRMGDAQAMTSSMVAEAMAERVAGPDRVLPFDLSFGAGMIRNRPDHLYYGPGEATVGHTGFGGSCVLADPDTGLSFAFCTNALSPALVEDERARRLIAATYACLE